MSVLIRPVNTEKANEGSELKNCYTFEVAKDANKIQIKNEVEATYGVKVKEVRTLNYGPKRATRYTKTGVQVGKTNAVKKALVQLEEGTIDFYSNI
ncbi:MULTISPECIES: 50S ribosomal protein L23 [Capnocytophaga]|jgi:ribosomal protein L23|uniref:Large ribosomal subunit protein uL23 n=1 Tax=Capnocytophaga leadbetteri TaxID=327575 RepID=A0A2T5XYB9_9FLAO|nr:MULTISPECIES: 50S ribosomal protein L23 [Capnocytophaga]KHE70729.1 ribosomal protein L23 [Capnocytophaga sp. oral taxon 329 str. F0087]MBB1546504.1 50S ribosomal protein L23 [Capnocytophaga sp.]MBB1568750.1 50S ribosomal protein L23 [Capnocytophaga sp.]PTX08532.1 large subunit ribosomal protein L23 [Capnocytophaga leadbetteri]QGS18624.1 50S ribosomal protein L23 [Capnocytophaga sp. FDAARGOS_737]